MSEHISTIKTITTECEQCDGSGLMYRFVSHLAARAMGRPELDGQHIQTCCTKCFGSGRVQS